MTIAEILLQDFDVEISNTRCAIDNVSYGASTT